ncbi:hypothetical protein [Sphingomonas sp. 2SG]|uniref:BPSS1187 family protein n=1 Tax=Sphingomonas sp. 2SG TaxID=2502201 RepID=UPI0010F8B060|nr:hypothetical protein [Sphingomonas sp. 2SG]
MLKTACTQFGAALAAAALSLSGVSAQELVRPSAANPQVRQYDDPNLVYAGAPSRNAPLVVFMPGTSGRSETAPRLLLDTIASQGYRVVFLTYNDMPAVAQVCPSRPPACSTRFRESRAFGGDGPPVATPAPEAIANRLGDLLRYLQRTHPDAGWSEYLDAEGRPAWPRIILSGLSQGAGMAAFMAQRYPVSRVVLFSSPWDVTGPDQRPAPWLFAASATPPARWWAERHIRENTTRLIANAYDALRIPRDHILLFDGGLPPGKSPDDGNPYHVSTVQLRQYVPQWRTMFGAANQ